LPEATVATAEPRAAPTVSEEPPESPSAQPSAAPRASASAAPRLPLVRPSANVLPSGGARRAQRDIVIATVRPPFGVLVRLDGDAAREVNAGMHMPADEAAHALRFSCVNDMCEPLERAVTAGSDDETLDISMVIRSSTLTVDGLPSATYEIAQEPSIAVRPGVPARIPMRAAKYPITLIELPSGRQRSATLTAGRETNVSFQD
jgi:hypothetical protein